MSKTATFVREIPMKGSLGYHEVRLYQLSEPVDSEAGPVEYVYVSAADLPYVGTETYMFPATADGEVIDWGELDGSYRGGLDHEQALINAGYEVA